MSALDDQIAKMKAALAPLASTNPADVSDSFIRDAKSTGDWLQMSGGGAMDPTNSNNVRASNGTWFDKSSGKSWGYATGFAHSGGFLNAVAGAVTSTVSTAAGGVTSVLKRAATDVTHPGELVSDIGAAVKAAPGVALAGVTGVAQLAVIGGAAAVEGVGKVTGSKALADAGRNVITTTLALDKSAVEDPVSSAELLAGGALVVTGIGTAAGLGLAGKGALGLAVDTISRGQPQTSAQLPAPHVDASGLSSSQLAPDAPTVSLFDRFRLWLKRELANA